MTSGRSLVLVAVLIVAAGLRLARLGTDLPLDVETTNAPSLDAFWYLEAASARADGVALEPNPAYDLEPWVTTARAWFHVVGPGYESACALGALAGVLGVLATFAFARPLGEAPALVAAALLAVCYPFVQQGRSPLIYGPLALALAGTAALYVRGGRAGRVVAWLLALALPVLLKAHAAALVGGLLLAETLRAPREWRARALVLGAFLVALALLVTWWLDPLGAWTLNAQRLANYRGDLTAPGIVERLLRLGSRPIVLGSMASIGSGIAVLSPALLALAAVGFALAPGELARLEPRARDVLAVATGWAATFALAAVPLDYRPIRYHVPVFPAAAVLAGFALARLRRKEEPGQDPAPPWASLVLSPVLAAIVAAHAADLAGALARVDLGTPALVASAFAGAALAIVAALARWRASPRVRRAVIALLAPLVLVDVLRDVRALARPVRTIQESRALLRKILPPGCVLAGPYSSVFAIGTSIERRRGGDLGLGPGSSPADVAASLRRLGYTHFLIDVEQSWRFGLEERLAEAHEPALLVAVFYVRQEPVFLFRLPWAACPESRFERARRIETAVSVRAATPGFEEAGALADRALALAHVRALVHAGKPEAAAEAAAEAYRRMPDDPIVAKLLLDVNALAHAVAPVTSEPRASLAR